jgi:hypothetical protein
MKPIDSNHRDLLDDLFAAEEIGNIPVLHDVLAAIQREKQDRRRRRRSLAAGAGLVALAGVAALSSFRPTRMQPLAVGAPARALSPVVAVQSAPEPFQIERVDDEGLLKLLADTPSALVHWRDGREALMLIVQAPPAER